MTSSLGYLPLLQSRADFVDYLEGFPIFSETDEIEGKTTRTRIKTYMLETARTDHHTPPLVSLFPDDLNVHALDDTLYRIEDNRNGGKVVGLLESIDDRHPVFYTTLDVKESDKFVRRVVDRNPWLDRLWLSSPILFELWQYVQRNTAGHRYVRLGFEHEARYESPHDLSYLDEADADTEFGSDDDDSSRAFAERRRSNVKLTERLSVLQEKLPHFQDLYDPLHSLVQLQIPSGDRGGHLLYYDGHATNWSDSFLEHRAIITLVLGLYRRLTQHAEDQLWVDTDRAGDDGFTVTGAPLTIKFHEPLSENVFHRFVELGLRRRTSRFRIGGYLTQKGPTKVHMVAIDRHLWQPFLLEVTSKQLLAVLPRGTCGNTIHRLVTNVQRYLNPYVDVWLGNEAYKSAVAHSMSETM